MKSSIIVFSTTKERAEHKLNQLFKSHEDRIVRRTSDMIETHSEYYRAIGTSQQARGVRAHFVYVDREIPKEDFDYFVLPCLNISEGKTEENIHYY